MKTTFILGAGFSVGEQFPLVRGLKERVVHFLEAEQHSSYRSHLRPKENFPEFKKGLFYIGLEEVDPDGHLGFEELLIELAKRKEEGQATVTNDVLRIGVSRLLWCKMFFIWRVGQAYQHFVQWLFDHSGDVAVVSFNWDLLIERALTEAGAPWSYSALDGTGSVPIIKPHGSINWSSYAQRPNLTAEYDGWKPIAQNSTLSYDAHDPLRNPDIQEINPDLKYCLYPGDPDLPESHPDLMRLWNEVEFVIGRSEKVVFIGYSLPSYDEFARQKLRALCEGKVVEVIDPSPEALANFQGQIAHAIPIQSKFRACQYAKPAAAG